MLYDNIELDQIILKFLEFISQNPEAATNFFSITGLQPLDLREYYGDYNFSVGIINYLASDEELLQNFCNNFDIKPEYISNIYAILSN